VKIPRIIPKLDIKGPNLVKGVNLEGLRVLGDPRSFIKSYYELGADELVYHDTVASLYLRNNLDKLLKATSKNIFMPIIVGGGIRSLQDVETMLVSGADRVFFNTAALENPKLIRNTVKKFGSATIVISIEAIRLQNNYICLKDFGRERTNIKVTDWILQIQDSGAGEVIITSINKEGTGKGFDLELCEKISKVAKIPFIINGGFGELKHISDLLNVCLPSGICISSAFHYGNKPSKEIKINKNEGNFEFLKKNKNFLNFGNISIKDVKNYINKVLK